MLLFLVVLLFINSSEISADEFGCPETYFIGCVTRIRLQRVPFDTNMLNVVFNVTSEAKLRQTCLAYKEALPCFRDKILQCGNEKQKRLLDEVSKMIKFFCSASSDEIKQPFLKHGGCLGKVLQLPVSTECRIGDHEEGKKLEMCRKICHEKREFLCMLKIWISEQSLCTLIDTEKTCGTEAAVFYQKLQTNVFIDTFPILCDYTSTLDENVATSTATSIAMQTELTAISNVAKSTVGNFEQTTIHVMNKSTVTQLDISTTTEPKTTAPYTHPSVDFSFTIPLEWQLITDKPTTKTVVVKPKKYAPTEDHKTPKIAASPEVNGSYNFYVPPENSYNRIVEVTALPRPYYTKLTVPPVNHPWMTLLNFFPKNEEEASRSTQMPSSPIIVTHPTRVDEVTSTEAGEISSPLMVEMQTHWRPWYLRGVDIQTPSTTTNRPIVTYPSVPTSKTSEPTSANKKTKLEEKPVSLSELFSFHQLQKVKLSNVDDRRRSRMQANSETVLLNRYAEKNSTDLSLRNLAWLFWNNSSKSSMNTSLISLSIVLFIAYTWNG